MTELAPVGYVGVSPKCLLGFNKVRIHFLCVFIVCSCFEFLKCCCFG